MSTALIMLNFLLDLVRVWAPLALYVAVPALGIKMLLTGRHNARVRAERRARDNYRAPVLDLTPRLARAASAAHKNLA